MTSTKSFRYDTTGTWYKGNTHLHSLASDGGKSYEELAALYAAAGYDFLAFTDHWVCSDVKKLALSTPMLLIDGIELDGFDEEGSYYHVVCLGTTFGIQREHGFVSALTTARIQGALTILAHPHWCGNTFDEAKRWQFDGVEVYNHVCRFLNGKGTGTVHWDAMLKERPNTLGFAVDDAHLRPEHPTWNGGWIVVNSDNFTADGVLEKIRKGNYYASQGPEMTNLTYDGEYVHLQTSPVSYIRLVGPDSRGQRVWADAEATLTEASLRIPEDWTYVYLEIEDQQHRRAWTNPLFYT